MIGRALQAWVLGWLVSFAIVVVPSAVFSLVRNGSLQGVEFAFFAFWSFAALLLVFCFLILPLYLWLPDRARELPPMVRAMLGAASACLACAAWPIFLHVPLVLPAALAAGGLIGYMVPRNIGAEPR